MEKIFKVYEALKWASSFLGEHGREAHAAELLLLDILKINRTTLFMIMRDELHAEDFERFQQAVQRHANGIPVQYIIGFESFFGRMFKVNGDVLIPRPETEELIFYALERSDVLFPASAELLAADIGTGSGAIAVTLKLERPKWQVKAVDLSTKALTIAKNNAASLGADVEFLEGDLLRPLDRSKKLDIVLSNPPYIPYADRETMSDVVVKHEPHQALFADEEGLVLYRKMCEQLPERMNSPGLIGFEVGAGQGQKVQQMLKKAFPQEEVEIVHDINGKDRMVFCRIKA
ncbi:peptide chain release factor N(5)-glutamine methyltransferase [Jeotgalibacillus soli]|uniref:Release factor glutamine methyltransferase n=1 Tax=Jeotgalibacillus soli TaxID=889306 RepID=A0A0C2S6U1_9BACL|nr:peptide chain release factor N(5)-glutamine methyltransferase [Jeotgalibacillus soli]KIL49754.1 hypothetical protein KP78_12220 [Jeotgalibacillus soli]